MKRLKINQFFLIFVCYFTSFSAIHSQILNIEDTRIRMSDTSRWAGYIDLAGNITKNISLIINGKATTQIEYKNKRHFVLSLTNYNWLKTTEQSVFNDGFQHLRYNYDISSKIVGEIFGQIQYNERLNLRARTLGAVGLRFKLWKRNNGRGYAGTAYMYEHSIFDNDPIPRRDHRLSNYISLNHQFDKRSKLFSTLYFQPLLTDLGINRLSWTASLQYFITQKISLRTSINLSFDNDPRLPPSVPDLTYFFNTGFRLDI
jgi:hypothetical protein